MYRICALFLSVTILGICKGARDSIVEKCLRKCDTAFDTLDGRGNLFCDKDCRQHECQTGCGYYEESINSSCKSVCDKPNSRDAQSFEELTSQTKIQNCVRGCNIALGIYVQDARKKLGYLPRPELNRKSKNYSSVEIKWTGNFLPNVTYLVHKRILDSNTEGNWHFHNSTQRHNSGFLITNLHPYVTYQFKIVVVISKTYLAESNYSVPITTLAHGVPASAPRITGLSAPSPTVITMSWRPPVFPNGPLLGYRINLNPKGNEDLKEVTKEVPSNATSWTLGQLQSSQLYIVSLSAWNAAGEGPASQGSATTLNPVTINETPFLILGADTKVCKQNIHNIIDIPNKLYRSHSNITGTDILFAANGTIKGVGIHRKRELIVVSDATGKVHLIPIGNGNEERRLNMYPSILKPTTISIDWLNDRVFIISRNRIYSCPLYSDNDECLVVIEGLKSSASDVKVDPLNGYMYYSDMGPGRGIFRVDLADIGKSGKIKQKQMVNYDKVTSFTMDFSNMQLYYPNATANTMMACYFDGSDVQNIRTNVMQGDFSNMLSLTSYKGLFYWTTGDSVMREAYDSGHKTYRQNEMLFFDNQYSGLNIYHPAVQPTPVPFMAPTGIQALFDSKSVHISWTPPEKLQYQGHGAWNKWDYSIEIYSSESNSALPVKTKRAVKESHISVNHLKPDTRYSIRIKALSDTGDGPWSDFFIGRTLKQESIPVKVYLSRNGAIMEHDLREHKLQNITFSRYHNVTDLTWYEDDVIWITTAGDLFVYNRTERIDYQNRQARIASCVAFDWLGKKIFWSEPDKNVVMEHGKIIELYKQRRGLWVDGVIRRSDLRGITSDSIYQTAARDMAIDSIAGRIYWATVNTIESTYLNGEGHTQIFMIPFFSGKHVISLTVNHDLQKVMWYVKSYENQDLYVADLVGLNRADISVASSTVRRIGGFNSIYRSSGLQYYSHHLFWLDESESLVVGDQMGNYSSLISPVTDYVSAFTVIHPSLQPYPAGKNSTNLVVVPHPMAASDITVVGHWSKFNLTWRSSTEVNHGQVYYKVYIQIRHKAYHKITKETSIPREGISPYTQMTVTIQPYTYWGYADSTTVPIRSPMSVPGKPLTPRVYVMQHKNATTAKQSMAADFRWSTPEFINGILQHHYVYHWEKGERNVTILRLPGTARHFTLNPLKSNKTYFFQVEACTEVGCGERSEIVSAKTDAVNPVPRLLIATKMSVLLSEMDEHRNSSVLLSDISPLAMAFLAQDERTFWIDQDTSLFVAKGSEKSRLMNLKSRGKDLTMDWISRTLYVVEEGTNNRNRIMGYQVDQENYITIVDRGSNIGSIVSDPYSSSLFWTEIDGQGNGNLYKSCLNGSNVVAVFGKMATRSRRSLPDHCSCRTNLNIAPVISMDYTEKGATEVVVVDKDSQTVLATDVDGCFCRDLFKPTQSNDQGLPPDLLAIDHTRVYWYNKDEGLLYSINKKTGQKLPTLDLPDTKDLVAYGVHLQPLPDSACLDPGAYNGTVEAIKITNTSVTLRLEEVKRPEQCRGISLPRDKFTIYYSKDEHSVRKAQTDCGSKDDSCLSVESYNKEVRIDRLEVYTNYVFQVAVSNYYTEYLAEAVGKQVRFATLHGAPSEPRNVSLNELSPYAVSVRWLPPLKSNGPEEDISYVAMWNTTNENGVMLEGKTDRSEVRMKKSGYLTADIGNLLPNHPYNVKVLAYDYTGEFYTESPAYQIRTCQEPNDIALYEVSNDTIAVTWASPTDGCVLRHSISCITYETQEHNYEGFNLYHTVNNTMYMVNFTNLEPNTKYNFKVNLVYKSTKMLKWPEEDRCMFKTLTGIPEKPEPPFVKVLKTETHEIVWESPKDRGAPIDYFLLEYSQTDTPNWTTLYNGSEQRWHVDLEKFTPSFSYVFRVAAHNKNGFGLSSDNSSVFAAPLMAKSTMNDTITIAVAVVVIVVTCIIIIAIVMCILIRKRQLEKSSARQFVAIRGPDVELATLRDLPHTAVQQSNTLYAFSIVPTDDDIAALPYFRRDQLVLTRFLGSGAFGEVFEGVAKNITDNPGETRVAVKTLRKSASEQEKEEFLKEALLMSNFKHEHILSLLGVCLDNDPQFIIMELMEGGDLLSYLRCCRATISSPPRLFLPDLIRVCVNVAAGCEYLEGMHFVHRDLAARNCLVSSKNPTEMIVKIGDFGLARDIYKNDYYRKEGEGLLPVRWMSPESLVDGVFTTPSDIWAFGVLMWEVITLGQQPYPARTNVEVLHFVRSGGKLDKPDKCPQEIYNLMENCWSFSPQERPSFASISLELKQIQQKCATMSPEEIIQSSPTADAGIEGTTSPTEEVSTQDKKFIPSEHNLSILTGGGSVRLTPTSKKRRLRNLMGGAEQSNEKLVVDLSTAGRIKRTISFDATHSNGHVSYSPVINPHNFNEFDQFGYLNPRAKNTPHYLTLLNHAPELEDYGLDSHQTSQTMRTDPHYNYNHISPYHEIPRSRHHSSSSNPPPYSMVRSESTDNPRSPRPSCSSDEAPYYHTNNIDSHREIEPRLSTGSWPANHPDRDIYSSPVFNGNVCESPPHSPGYCADCHKNVSNTEMTVPFYLPVQDAGTCNRKPDKPVWANNNSDKVYNACNNGCKVNSGPPNPEYMNYHSGGRSRAQVFPEPGTALAGFDISQASLV